MLKRLALLMLLLLLPAVAARYDPLQPLTKFQPLELQIDGNRPLPLRVYLTDTPGPAPVLLFSHGLGGSCEGYAYLGKQWASRGYVSVHLQHPGSDDSVWRDVPPEQRMEAMRKAASGRNLLLREEDVTRVLDTLTVWNATEGNPLHGRLDMSRVGMSGHSFGALTTQMVSGEDGHADPRIKAAVIMSPSSPRRGSGADAFASVQIPWMLMTGTEDAAPIGDQKVADRLAVFPALPPGDKYELVLDGARHLAFSDREAPGRNPNHHRAILALSTAFWDTYLRGDAAAKAWLTGSGARQVLQPADEFEMR
ncbi:MAG: alpha/beta hydrolase family protein [Candidatus Xenobia bacterium]